MGPRVLGGVNEVYVVYGQQMNRMHQLGLTLLETTVALVVLSSGVLVLGALQLSLSQQAKNREIALKAWLLASNIAELRHAGVPADRVYAVEHTALSNAFQVTLTPSPAGERLDIYWSKGGDGGWDGRLAAKRAGNASRGLSHWTIYGLP